MTMRFHVAVTAACAALACAAAAPAATSSGKRASAASGSVQQRRLTANDADVAFALATVESALKQYAALPEAKKRKLDAKIARVAGAKDVSEVSATLRLFSASLAQKPLATKENRAAVQKFLNENQKWCGTVKATRLARQAMAKMGIGGEMTLDDIVNLLPE